MGNNRFSQPLKRMMVVALAGLVLLPAAANAAAQPIGGLTQSPGTLTCVSHDGSSEAGAGTCQVGRGLALAGASR